MRLADEIADLLPEPGGEVRLERCPVSGNNRVFVVTSQRGRYIAKRYFVHPSDRRDRLHAEWSFLEYAQRMGVESVPRPLRRDPARSLALYEFRAGRRPAAEDIGAADLAAAADFVRTLNRRPDRDLHGAALPVASEACFSLDERLEVVDRRIARLSEVRDQLDDLTPGPVLQRLRAVWARVRARARGQDGDGGAAIPPEERCVSPSDFGFHNALRDEAGRISFIDFEYAGWDDPAKLIGDFFAQPAVPVPGRHFDTFAHAVAGFAGDRQDRIVERARVLRPVYQTKWCCIMLNEFLPEAAERRRFADPGRDASTRRRLQLGKVERALDSVVIDR